MGLRPTSHTLYIITATVDSDTGGICYGFTAYNPIPAAVKTAMEAGDSDLDYLMKALVNKLVITEATGNTEMFDDADSTLGTIAAAFSSDGTNTTRKRMVI